MKLGKVCGTVVATVKDPALSCCRLRLMYPAIGGGGWSDRAIVAIDTVGSREGDTVIWISAREATLALTDRIIPTDASIVGIVD
ncbi:MAG TPA: EutN/CcmL family microcompartment protein [candidate division Zixibacteria bacterium]|jgi:ethanolamine utilization protein EutN